MFKRRAAERPHVPDRIQRAAFLIAHREVGVPRRLDALGDLVERPVEGLGLPFVGVGSPIEHGLHAVRVDGQEQRVRALGAERALVDRAARVALDVDELAGLGVDELAAADGAVGTEAVRDGRAAQPRGLLRRPGAEWLGLGSRRLRAGHEW